MDFSQYSPTNPPPCPYCGGASSFMPTSKMVYSGRDYGPIYLCEQDRAYVGVHRATNKPLGRLAGPELRPLKIIAHNLFDPLWRDLRAAYPDGAVGGRVRSLARKRAYAWLAAKMNIPPEECHVAAFDEERCRSAIIILETYQPTSATIRKWAKEQA